MAAWLDICRFYPTAGGTSDWTYSAAVLGHQSPTLAGVVNSRAYKYRAESADLSQWELGEGTYNTGTGVLTRTTVLYNSSGTGTGVGQSGAGTKINFSTTPQVAVVALKEDLLSIEEANSFTETQRAQARTNLNAAPFDALGSLGLQINGSFDVSQENSTTQITIPASTVKFSMDGYKAFYTHGAATAVLKTQQVAPPGSPSFGLAFPKCLQFTATTALSSPAAGDRAVVFQNIEGLRWARLGFGNANAQSVTISFWVYATIAGTMSAAIVESAGTRSYPVNVTINNALTWEYKTVTIPGDQSGTWSVGTAASGSLFFTFCCGSTFQGTANTWNAGNFDGTSSTTNFFATSGNTVCIAGLLIVPGTEAPIAARSPFIMRPYPEELIICQRYFQKSFPQAVACAQNAGVAGAISVKNPIALGDPSALVQFMPTMRAAPTITTYNPSAANANWRDITAGSDSTVSVDPGSTLSDRAVLLATSGTVTTLGDILAIHFSADARI